jgi:hypothetical protein
MAESNQTLQTQPKPRWKPVEMFWLAILVISILVGFGMTIFAPV